MLSVEEALARVGEALGAAAPRRERVALADALGRVLAEDVRMDHDVPPFRRASMDGYAVRAGDARAGARLRVAGGVVAGAWPAGAVEPGEAWRVMTGAPVPEGTGVVVPFEATRGGDTGAVTIASAPAGGSNVVERGAHLPAGALVLPEGSVIGPGAIGGLASAGRGAVQVFARPRVAVLGTGSELVAVDQVPGPAEVRNSNAPMLCAQARRAGAEPLDLGIAPDEPQALGAAIQRGLEADVLVCSGGVSRGERDLVPGALEAAGVCPLFHRWAVQPGGPCWVGVREGRLVFGLPGNPAASFVCFELLVVPALCARLGRGFRARTSWRARWSGPWGRPSGLRRFRPVRLSSDERGLLVAEAAAWTGSGDPFAATRAHALAVLPEGMEAPDGAASPLVDVIPLEGEA